MFSKLVKTLKGGAGSGNFGHTGRPGKVGGSGGAGNGAAKPLEAREFRKFGYLEEDELEEYYDLSSRCGKTIDCQSIEDYTEDEVYEEVNNALRSGEEKDGGRVESTVAELDAAFEDAPKVPEDMVVFRGLSKEASSFLDLGVGDSFQDGAFVSTSTQQGVAERFSGRGGTLMEIRIKEGSKGIFTSELSAWPDENEMLLPRGLSFKVVDKISGRTTVDRLVVEVE